MVSSKGASTGVRRTRPERAKEKEEEDRIPEVTDNKEAKEHHRARGRFRKKEEEVRGEDEVLRGKVHADLRQRQKQR